MTTTNNWEKEFDDKIVKTSDEGGFIMLIEGEDNLDFDCDLIKDFIKSLLLQKDKEKEEVVRGLKESICEKIEQNIAYENSFTKVPHSIGMIEAYQKVTSLVQEL